MIERLYEILSLNMFGNNQHGVYCSNGQFYKHSIEGDEKDHKSVVIFATAEAADEFATTVAKLRPSQYHICRVN
jgi:hypothetical protein